MTLHRTALLGEKKNENNEKTKQRAKTNIYFASNTWSNKLPCIEQGGERATTKRQKT